MSSMYLALGYSCNHNCYFCPCGEKSTLTSIADTQQLLMAIDSGIQTQKITHITLSGGEPSLHPDFKHILNYCIKNGLRVTILTNGDNFANLEFTNNVFKDVDKNCVSVTSAIHSHLYLQHEAVTNSEGSFYRTIQGLLNIEKCGIPITVKQVVSKWNYTYLPEFVDFVFKTFGPNVSLTLCGMDFCGMLPEKIDEVAIEYSKIQCKLEEALDLVISLRQQFGAFPQMTVADLPLCCIDPYYWGFFTKVSRHQLSQYSAPIGDEGNIKIFNKIENDCDVYFEACKSCCVSKYCPGIWHSAYKYFGESVVQPIYNCMK